MTPKLQLLNDKGQVALCYVRQSWTRDENDTNSPDRQRANILAVCEQNNWIPEWYVDAEGHRSGRTVKNRPGWLALEQRLGDSDVVALVANDLSRLHRKGWRVGSLLELLDKNGINLMLAASGNHLDLTSPQGRIFVQMSAWFDEWYAEDISRRAKDSVAYRKKLGVTVGIPPFGTVRDENGFLIPSPEGVWMLPNGSITSGKNAANPPVNGAVWRGYYQAAEKVLSIYAENRLGHTRIADELNQDHWFYRNRDGQPVP